MSWFIDHPDDLRVIEEIEDPNIPDRMVGIVAPAFLDGRLADRLRARFHGKGDVADRTFRPSGALGPFMARANIGFLLGLYSRAAYDDLKCIADIRNAFAHKTVADSFDHPLICGQVDALQTVGRLQQDGWLHGGRTIYEATIVGPTRPVPVDRRNIFLVTVRILFAAISSVPNVAPPDPEF